MTTAPETCRITVWLKFETVKFSAEEISEQIGILPNSSHKIGDLRGATGKQWETNGWILKEHLEAQWESHYEAIQDAVDRLLRKVDAASERIRRLSAECKGQFLVGTVSRGVPGLHLNNNLLCRLANLGVDVEIDIICWEDCEQK
jgi:hypothetical protein